MLIASLMARFVSLSYILYRMLN